MFDFAYFWWLLTMIVPCILWVAIPLIFTAVVVLVVQIRSGIELPTARHLVLLTLPSWITIVMLIMATMYSAGSGRDVNHQALHCFALLLVLQFPMVTGLIVIMRRFWIFALLICLAQLSFALMAGLVGGMSLSGEWL